MSVAVLRSDLAQTIVEPVQRPEVKTFHPPAGWSPESFVREQMSGLVRQIFFSSVAHPVKQVVISAVDAETEVWNICQRIGETLAGETRGSVAVISRDIEVLHDSAAAGEEKPEPSSSVGNMFSLRQTATRVSGNLWFVPENRTAGPEENFGQSLASYLREIRREFDYSIIQGLPAGESYEAVALGQHSDGIVLVLSASNTRKATASTVISRMKTAQTRLLGTVLTDRTFPIPEGIYRRL
jgi:hypothetical protein